MSKSNQEIEDFITNFSFDVLSSISAINSVIESGLDGKDLTPEQTEYFELIRDCSTCLLQSHDDLLEFLNISKKSEKIRHEQRNQSATDIFSIPLRILLVEDEPISKRIFEKRLSELGFEVSGTSSTEEALKLFEENAFDMIFLDLYLEHQESGLKVAQTIRKMEAEHSMARTPIVALTAAVVDEVAKDCEAAGIDQILTKPIQFKSILRVLKSHVLQTSSSDYEHEDDELDELLS